MVRMFSMSFILASLLLYTAWGGHHHAFLFEIEYALFSIKGNLRDALGNPLVAGGLAGQICLLLAALTNGRFKWLFLVGFVLLSLIVLLFLLVGIVSGNSNTIVSTLPYVGMAFLFFYLQRKKRAGGDTAS
jgi:hypothetical protein